MKSPSSATWDRVIKQAHAGDPRHLLELLLQPTVTDNSGRALPDSFHDLPDDGLLRERIVRVLMLGPWKEATTLAELRTRTGWGRGKPALSEVEVAFADLADRLFSHGTSDDKRGAMEGIAEALQVKPETLRKRIGRRRKG